jgi:3-phenylpropionate/cinnamic acid dioxygenase small subunit
MSDMRSGIENTLYRYAWTYDMNELDDIAECFATDAECEFMDTGLKVGREAVATEMRRRRSQYTDGSIPWHVITNVYITNETDTEATVRSWYTFFVQSPDGAQKFTSIGWYDDVFGLEDGVWRIKRRRIRRPHDR